MNWIKVNDDDHSTLPPMGQVVWIVYTSGYDGGPVMELGGRDDDGEGWLWGVLDSHGFARNWEPKLYGLEFNDDYNVTHWAALQWPE
jgi:hypothetical protein